MLEIAIVHRPGLVNGKHDLGRVLETMLYYDHVHLIISGQFFLGLWDQLSPDDVAALLNHPGVTSTLTPEMVGVSNTTNNGMTTHRPVAFKLSGRDGRLIPDHDDAGSLLQLVSGNPNRATATRAQINKIIKLTKKSRYAKILGGEPESRARFNALASDPATLKLFLRGWARANNKTVNEVALERVQIEPIEMSDGLMIVSNLPISELIKGWDGQSEWGDILSNIKDYATDLYLSSNYSADIVTTPEVEHVASARLDLTLQRAKINADQITAFEEMAIEQAHSFANAYNSGLISLHEALKIIDQSRKFRTWTRSLAPDANLLVEYHRAITRETALKRFPLNIARFAFFNLGGMAGDAAIMPGSSLGMSAIDSFILDRLTGGWRPNIFVRNLQKSLEKARDRSIKRAGKF